MKLTLAFALIASLAATGPVSSEPMPLYTVSGTFQILGGGAGTSLELLDQRGGEIARYDLSGCEFARANEMRSPIGRRAIFGQSKKGAPWVLEVYVAGD